ncbi:hypothetical protein THAOC_25442, partial [Thalassiosira oceanica]
MGSSSATPSSAWGSSSAAAEDSDDEGPAEDEGGDGKDACATGPGPPMPPLDVTLEIRVGGTPGEDDGMARTVGPLPPRSGTAWTPRRRDDDDASDDKGARARLPVYAHLSRRPGGAALRDDATAMLELYTSGGDSRRRPATPLHIVACGLRFYPGGELSRYPAARRIDSTSSTFYVAAEDTSSLDGGRHGWVTDFVEVAPLRPHFADPGRQVEWKGALVIDSSRDEKELHATLSSSSDASSSGVPRTTDGVLHQRRTGGHSVRPRASPRPRLPGRAAAVLPRHPPGSLHSADDASSGQHGGGDDVAPQTTPSPSSPASARRTCHLDGRVEADEPSTNSNGDMAVDPYALGPAGLVLGDDVPCSNPRLWRGSTHLRTKAVAVRVAREEGIFAATATRRARGLNLLLIYEKHSSPCPFPFTVWNGLMAGKIICSLTGPRTDWTAPMEPPLSRTDLYVRKPKWDDACFETPNCLFDLPGFPFPLLGLGRGRIRPRRLRPSRRSQRVIVEQEGHYLLRLHHEVRRSISSCPLHPRHDIGVGGRVASPR